MKSKELPLFSHDLGPIAAFYIELGYNSVVFWGLRAHIQTPELWVI